MSETEIADVKAYGAFGDGLHDDTLAIQHAADTGLPLVWPPGIYRISRTITIPWAQGEDEG